jgi:hypothetical protein
MKKGILRFFSVKLLVITALSLEVNFARAQNVSINEGGAAPDSSAMLDVSSRDKGVLIPRMRTAERLAITNPANSLLVYQTDGIEGIYIYLSSSNLWQRLSFDSSNDLAAVLARGNDANGDSIINLGLLGVGTNNPLGKVEVSGDGSLAGGLRVSGTTSATVGASIYLNAAAKDWTITATNTSSSAGNNKLVFRDYSSAADRMTIDGVGNVGIGTTNPAYLLDVNGAARVSSLRVNTTNLQYGASMEVANRLNIFGTGNPNIFIGNSGTNYFQLLYNSLGYGQLFTPGTIDIVLNAGGNVGIGISNPSSELEVAGDVEIPAANDYTYSTAKTHYQSFAPTTFNSLLPDQYGFGTNAAADWYGYFRSGATAFGYATVEVNLPDGAVVSELRGWIFDNVTTNPVRVELIRQQLGASNVSNMARVESATATAINSVQNIVETNIFNATIDNLNYAYFLRFTGLQNSSNTRLYGARITYTVTEAD